MQKQLAVVAAIIQHENTVFIARRGPGSHLAGHWELPGGKVKHGEDPREALTRELYEELRIHTKVGDLFMNHCHDYPEFSVSLSAYFVTGFTGTITPMEHDRTGWIEPIKYADVPMAPADTPILAALARDPLFL